MSGVSAEQIKLLIQQMNEHVSALFKKSQEDQKYYQGATDSLTVLMQEINKIEEGRKEESGKSSKAPEKVRAIRTSSNKPAKKR